MIDPGDTAKQEMWTTGAEPRGGGLAWLCAASAGVGHSRLMAAADLISEVGTGN